MADFRLDRIGSLDVIVGPGGRVTPQMQRRWQKMCEKIEEAFDDIGDRVTQLELDAVQDIAETAKLNDKISSSYTVPTSCLSAVDAGSDATVTVAGFTRYYGDGTSVAVMGTSFTAQPYETAVYVYYDDATCADTTPTLQLTTTALDAQANKVEGRHFVGAITTPASGGSGTSGGGSIPWWKDGSL